MNKYYISIVILCTSLAVFSDQTKETKNASMIAIAQDSELISPNIKVRIAAKFRKLNKLNRKITKNFITIDKNMKKLNTIIKDGDSIVACSVAAVFFSKVKNITDEIEKINSLITTLKTDLNRDKSKKEKILSLEQELKALYRNKTVYFKSLKKTAYRVRKLNCKSSLIIKNGELK